MQTDPVTVPCDPVTVPCTLSFSFFLQNLIILPGKKSVMLLLCKKMDLEWTCIEFFHVPPTSNLN